MAPVRVAVTVEVDQKGNGLLIRKPVPLHLVCEDGRWHAECEEPNLCTDPCDSMEQAVLIGAHEVTGELQAAVVERPMVAGKISPESVPQGMF